MGFTRFMCLFAAAACFAGSAFAERPAKVDRLQCEYVTNPLGIQVTQPRLQWQMQDERRGAKQTAYQVLVASTAERLAGDEADLWDSGKVESDRSTQIVYSGKPLRSRDRCYWKVRIWDAEGEPTAYSVPALWTMGLLDADAIEGKWIGLGERLIHPAKLSDAAAKALNFEGCAWFWYPDAGAEAKTAPPGIRYFRKTIEIPEDRTITSARFLIAADDSGSLFINGQACASGLRFGGIRAEEVKAQLQPGENVLGIQVQNGGENANPAGVMGKLVIKYEDGRTESFVIDETWKGSDKEAADWNTAEADTADWKPIVKIGENGCAPWGEQKVTMRQVFGSPQLRKDFDIPGEVRRATVYASALGNYKLHINGEPVGNAYFTPGWTDYKKRVYYDTYDVTDLVRSNGPNAIGADLAAGWYAGAIGWKNDGEVYGHLCKVFVQLEIETADGKTHTVISDGSWKAKYGPRIDAEFLAGETYDARLETPGWTEPGFDDADWSKVAEFEKTGLIFEGFPGVPVRETSILKPIGVTEPKPGRFVFDLGQNFAGFARLKVTGDEGTKVTLRFAEMLNPDGTIYTENLRGAKCTDTYICKGTGEEVWQPLFTFHGFRYVEVTGYPGVPPEDAITGIAVNSHVPLVGEFRCSNPMVNQLYSNIVWTQRANFIEVPTDCPQRDERLGWTGDAQVFIRAATYNADCAAFYTKWLVDLEDAQRADGSFTDVAPDVLGLGSGTAGWADAGTICPWTTYWVYDDKRVLMEHYDAMVRYIDYLKANSKDLIRPAAGYGDWLSIEAETPKDVLATAYFGYSVAITAEVARILGHEEDAKKYEALFEEVKAAFNKAFVEPDGRIKGNTQTCYVLALAFNMLPEDKREAAAEYLVEDIKSRDTHLSTGFNGTAYLMPTLASIGANDVAYQLLLNDTFPSWGYSIKHGATSIWERWDGWTAEKGFQDPGMNSFAHYSFGAVARWMFQTAAGIDTDGPGFKRLRIAPRPGPGLDWLKASYDSLYGKIVSEWEVEDDFWSFKLVVPANTSAEVSLPTSNPEKVTEGGLPLSQVEGIQVLPTEGDLLRLEVPAGRYRFMLPR